MSTQLQKNLAKAVVNNVKSKKPKTAKELVVSSGYDLTTAEKQVPVIFEQKGFIEELAKLGFDENNAKRVVGEILNEGKDEHKLKAADMIFKVNATYAPERQEIKQTVVNVNFFGRPDILQATQKYDEILKQAIINEDKESTQTIQD